ncbi:MAG: PilT/PilU family type 4a pilus ATPase [Actinomycetota bacterium]|nr:PilT/PilU family type 4a pilus ATPase [Actinomycetota bacterium]
MIVNHDYLDGLLRLLGSRDGSDLHLKAGVSPRVRVKGVLSEVSDVSVPTADDMIHIARSTMTASLWDSLEVNRQADYAFSASDGTRFRVNAFFQRGMLSMAFRRVLNAPSTVEELGLPPVVTRLANERRGLILVTGPTGSGKTTTLASMIGHINRSRACHIITIEDPIEVLQRDEKAYINQREVGSDAVNFAMAMKAAMREDPDVILVGEMRDEDTVHAALAAAETGHLVLSTLHTTNAKETVSRIIDFFPAHQHGQIRAALAGSLRGVVCQRLVRTNAGGLRPVMEIMVGNGRIAQAILEPNKGEDIHSIIKDGEFYGMLTFEKSLFDLISTGMIDVKEALMAASSPQDLQVMLQRTGQFQPV